MTRRTALQLASAPLLSAAGASTALALNEDSNHYFASRAGRRITEKDLTDWVDQYAGTQVRELIMNVNAQRTAFASKVWTPFWKGYDPKGPDNQPLFASVPAAEQKFARAWVHTAWQMNADGLDHFAIWIRQARKRGLSPWLSIRMNDLHNVDDEQHYLHSDFWRTHKELRRVPYRDEQRDKALDFGREEVRDYTLKLVEEVASRYDFDGLELDWMRHGFHFAPGREDEGREHLNRFMYRVRRLVGKRKIGVRVPPHPQSALRLGLDAASWARHGCADMVVPTNYWRTVDTGMPMLLWKQLLPADCVLGAGLELGLNPHLYSKDVEGRPFSYNTLQTVRGAAAAYLEQGANRVYLFNYMDSQTAIENLRDYQPLLRECGTLSTIAGKPRRHIVTYTDTWAPGEPVAHLLPAEVHSGNWKAFRIATGPVERNLRARVRIASTSTEDRLEWVVRVNTIEAELSSAESPVQPWPRDRVLSYDVPRVAMHPGDTVIDLQARQESTLRWVELAWV